MKVNKFAFKGFAVMTGIVCASTTVLSGSASAATQFPSGNGDGIRVDWSGQWVNANRLEEITLQLCDATPTDKNQASAVLQGYVNGKIRVAPTVFRVPIGDKACYEWRNVFLTYFQDGETLAYARVQIYGSQAPTESWFTRWVINPFWGA
ncbi:hypothetical protein [Streptomyces sp. NPDC018711]|uniref:hypothetical protein n=1 Tax=Streptomyces sp. NPDC018711 TaxID=3365052 RepID=UPI00379D7F59